MTGQSDSSQFRSMLFVDLDGTLLRTDSLWESFLLLLKSTPLTALMVPFWLLRGRAALKSEIAARVRLDPVQLPYSGAVLAYIAEAHRHGSRIFLATAAYHTLAHDIAQHLGVFSGVIASDSEINLKASAKSEAILRLTGGTPFDYIGNAPPDIPVWQSAGRAIVANPSAPFRKKLAGLFSVHALEDQRRSLGAACIKAIRVHQWVKNLLIFLPMLLAHNFTSGIFMQAALAFFAFSFCASGVYLLNDLLDLSSDRNHATKKNRPFASGDLPVWSGLALFPVLFLAAGAISLLLPTVFMQTLGIYALLTTVYSFYLKRIPLLDVITLASLYSIRLFAGSSATSVKISQWLTVFSMFVFLSLAFVKRYTELLRTTAKPGTLVSGRGYRSGDTEMIASFGTASGYLSVLVFCLYCYSRDVVTLYSTPELLLIVAAVHLFWISRVWFIAHRGELDDDPILFALRDPVSYIIGAIAALVVYAAI